MKSSVKGITTPITTPKVVQVGNRVSGRGFEVLRATRDYMGTTIGIEFIKDADAHKGIFLVKSLWRQGKEIWSFKKEEGFKGLAKLCGLGGELFIVLDSFGIIKVIPLADIFFGKKSSAEQLLNLKMEFAKIMKTKAIFNKEEEAMMR